MEAEEVVGNLFAKKIQELNLPRAESHKKTGGFTKSSAKSAKDPEKQSKLENLI